MCITSTLSTDKQIGVTMLKFKEFNIEDFKTDVFGNLSEKDLIFIYEGVLRFGHLYEHYHGNGTSTYYLRSNGVNYEASDVLYSIVEV